MSQAYQKLKDYADRHDVPIASLLELFKDSGIEVDFTPGVYIDSYDTIAIIMDNGSVRYFRSDFKFDWVGSIENFKTEDFTKAKVEKF